jgi:hypothetical protein
MATVTNTLPTIVQDGRTEEKTHSCMVEGCHSSHFVAQDLNNEACSLISRVENLPQSIRILTKALELSKWGLPDEDDTDMDIEPPCSWEHCSLDAIIFSKAEDDASDDKNTRASPLPKNPFASAAEREEKRFVYRRPLRVSETCIQESHYMGATLTVMILFNLGIAHQLLATSIPSTWSTFNTRMTSMNKALQIYELCIHAHNDCGCSEAAGLRLKLLVMNNLGEIHKLCGSPTKHRMCLEYLLRGIMFVAHGREGEVVYDFELLSPEEIDDIYQNIQSSSFLFGKNINAGAA